MSFLPSRFGGQLVSFNVNASGAPAQIIAGSGDEPIRWQTVVWDHGVGITVPTETFMPPVAGYYQLNGAIAYASTEVGWAVLRKNFVDVVAQATYAQRSAVSALVYLNGTDFLQLCTNRSGSGDGTIDNAAERTWFNGILVKEA